MIKIWPTEHLQNCNGIIYVNVSNSHLCCSGTCVKVLQIDQSHSWSAVLLEWRNLLFVVLVVMNVNWCLLDSILSYTVKRMRSSTAFKGHIKTRMCYSLLHVLSALICIWLTSPVGLQLVKQMSKVDTFVTPVSMLQFCNHSFCVCYDISFSAKLKQFFVAMIRYIVLYWIIWMSQY